MSGVDTERFWAIVDEARGQVNEWSVDLDQQWAHALYTQLVTLPPDDILEFDRRLATARRSAESPEMAAATLLVVRPRGVTLNPVFFVFEMKFEAFATCLVMLGREVFERACADPDSLADHPLIRAVGARLLDPSVLLALRVGDAAGDAYCEVTGLDDDDYLDLVSPSTTDDRDAAGDNDDEDDNDDDDEGAAWLAERLPRLQSLFPLEAEQPAEIDQPMPPSFISRITGGLLPFVIVRVFRWRALW
jgi:hypothetical protein